MNTPAAPQRLQLRIALENIEPPIWRRVIVPDNLSFAQLHKIIQRAMGWGDYHLHEFEVGEVAIGDPAGADDVFGGPERKILPEAKTRLGEAIGKKRKFRYWYDFGDDWWHTIAIEKRLPPDPETPPVQLVAGERACPPEDCGGPWGYAELLLVLADPAHPEHEEMQEWVGEFDPEAFDLAATDKAVAKTIRAPRQGNKTT